MIQQNLWCLFKKNDNAIFLLPIIYQDGRDFFIPDFNKDMELVNIDYAPDYGTFYRFIPERIFQQTVEKYNTWEEEDSANRFFFIYPDI